MDDNDADVVLMGELGLEEDLFVLNIEEKAEVKEFFVARPASLPRKYQ